MHQLLKQVKAPPEEVAELKRLYDEQRRSGLSPAPAATTGPAAPEPARPAQARASSTGERPAKALRPWIEVALPHPDVLANRFKEAEFAADLFAVDAGHATEDYAAPESFFRITFLTEGLKRVLTSALQRLAGTGGDPVIGLQTAFGGGKTHTLLAVYHLAKATDLALLEGVKPLADAAGVTRMEARRGWPCSSAPSKGTDVSLPHQGRPAPAHAVGLHRLAARRRGRAEAGRRGRGRAHQPRLGADGRGVQAGRPQPDPARRAGRLRPPAPRRPVRGAAVLHPVADRGGEDGAGRAGAGLAARERGRGGRPEGPGGAAAAGEDLRPRAVGLAAGRRATRPTRSSAGACSRPSTPTASGRATRRSRPSTTSTARTRPSSRPRPRRAATSSCCASPTRSTPSCSTG